MGELIRNLHPIKLGAEELMTELNEGYHKHQGRVIHIQNKKFRFLMREKPFLQLATTVLRARDELVFYKQAMTDKLKNTVPKSAENASETDRKIIKTYSDILNQNSISYRFIEAGAGYATFIVNPADKKKFTSLMKKNRRIKKSEHIYSKKMGYSFLYQMNSFSLYIYNGVLFEIFYQLPCLSMTPKTWVPLDRCIQERIFKNNDLSDDGIYLLDKICLYIYRLCWAVFVNNSFHSKDIALLNSLSDVLNDGDFKQCMYKVFFAYTDELINKLKNREYDSVIPGYFTFTDY